MSARWTSDEDAFLLLWHWTVGADYVASRDLNRPDGAGSRWLRALTKSGARRQFAQATLHMMEFDRLAGREVDPDFAE